MADAKTEKQKVKEITDKLEEGLKELFESEKYKSYLSTMSKFHNYSFNNTLLIALQRPDATLVAGYQAWQKNFNRHVNKGEKGIRILAPAPYKIKEERDKLDPVTGEVMLDQDGMPQTEEVEVKIPAFRAVSVFDVAQTSGEPLPELEAKELLSTVEGYEDFINAITYVAPAPIGFEDIPGDSKGYFNIEENRIAVQEGMSESQTLKTMVHETAHSMLHNKEVNKEDILASTKDRNTKEVEAESIAFTVCNHFGIDTSDYSFGYIAGWSSGKDMKELKSSLDTIRRTASELIMGIEEQLREIQRDREIMQEQEKESLLLVQNSDLSEYSLLNVRGMDGQEIIEALSAMNDDDRLSVAAYLESKGAWTTEIANEGTREFGEYHLDVRYITDRNEIIDLKAEMAWNERAKEPVGADDVILKITHSHGFEVERITNKTPEEVREIMGALTKLEAMDKRNIHDCLESCGADYIPIIVEGGRNSSMPQFNDFEIDLNKKEVVMMVHLSPVKQAEGIIKRLEFAKTAFSDDERSLIVNYAFKLNDMEKTRELAEHIYYEETEGSQGAAPAVIDAQAEIDALPDPVIGLWEMEEYGYTGEGMLPLTKEMALELFDRDLTVYQLHEDGSETLIEGREQADISAGKKQEQKESLSPEQTETEVTLTVAECGEFHNLGEFYENIPTVEEAVAIWKQIPPERMNGIPAIGVNIHTPGTDAFEDVGIDILTGKRIDLDILEYIPDIKGNPQAMEVIAELVAKLPEMEIDGRMSEEFEAKVWEKRMPDLTPAEQLAVEIDRFVYQYDTVQYHDNSCNMTENVAELAEDLRNHDIMPMAEWLAQVSAHEGDTEEGRQAKELLMKVAEYKPLAKIEEMEEQNYNMVDNVLNNGAGEKAQKEENKKDQERPAARASLKARLAEKKALVSGQGKDHEAQENIKNNQREM